MIITTTDVEYLIGQRELELLHPDNGMSPYYQRVILGAPYHGALETFQIVNMGRIFRGTLCQLIVGNISDGRIIIRMTNQDVLPNGAIIENTMFSYTRDVDNLNELQRVFGDLDLKAIIETGRVTDEQIESARVYCR